jgi:Ca-activated chloride channel homolog
MFSFEHKEFLLLLCVLPLLLGIYIFFSHRRMNNIRKLGNPVILASLMPDYSKFRNNLKFFLLLIAVFLLTVAIAGPRFGSKLSQVKHEGIDIVVALDVSNSMLAQDIKPSRIERAKQELARLLDKLENDRIGLIVFAGDAYTQIPITNDYLSAKMFLSGISTEMVSRQGTDIGAAINLALKSFNPESKAGKAIVIISDGEDHEGGIEEACKKATDMGVKIFTVGMGMVDGVRIPVSPNPYDRDFRRDKDGNFVVTKLNEQMLMNIANEGGGKYYRADMPNMGFGSMLAQLNKMNKVESEYKQYSEYEEQFPGIVWIALGVILLEMVILERKNKWLKNIHLFKTV